MEKFNELKKVLAEVEIDAKKAYDGNAAAGTRLRVAMQEVKALAQAIRVEIQAAKNAK